MTRTLAWAVVGKDGNVLVDRITQLLIFDAESEANNEAQFRSANGFVRVVRVVIEIQEG